MLKAGFETLLNLQYHSHDVSLSDDGPCDCHDCDYNCEECDNCDCDNS